MVIKNLVHVVIKGARGKQLSALVSFIGIGSHLGAVYPQTHKLEPPCAASKTAPLLIVAAEFCSTEI